MLPMQIRLSNACHFDLRKGNVVVTAGGEGCYGGGVTFCYVIDYCVLIFIFVIRMLDYMLKWVLVGLYMA